MPHNRNTAKAEVKPEMKVMEVAESLKRLLSESNPKNEDDMMPGALNKVSSRVDDTAEIETTDVAYVFK